MNIILFLMSLSVATASYYGEFESFSEKPRDMLFISPALPSEYPIIQSKMLVGLHTDADKKKLQSPPITRSYKTRDFLNLMAYSIDMKYEDLKRVLKNSVSTPYTDEMINGSIGESLALGLFQFNADLYLIKFVFKNNSCIRVYFLKHADTTGRFSKNVLNTWKKVASDFSNTIGRPLMQIPPLELEKTNTVGLISWNYKNTDHKESIAEYSLNLSFFNNVIAGFIEKK